MRSKLVLLVTVCSLLVGLACQKAQTPQEFVKYKDEAGVPRVSVQDAKAELDAGTAIMVDARPAEAYNQEHIAGSINVPVDTPPEKFNEQLKDTQGKKIFAYCSCPNEHTSARLAFQMNQANIPGTYALIGGNISWKNAGYPMEKSANSPAQPANQ